MYEYFLTVKQVWLMSKGRLNHISTAVCVLVSMRACKHRSFVVILHWMEFLPPFNSGISVISFFSKHGIIKEQCLCLC